ncbi:hypothetical protein BS50DRAFT_379721 [Corynespora cassiicola Philippines]|uniref:Uncharacterized protein n=1 Tax=Corynespora cassiicola Philippines TaxID=1448308 RepID=A0A2T2NNN5_CORCC|nr:hypothetical protein BS50DRAFT_379721 [Corynespora cassiicola Philippines]
MALPGEANHIPMFHPVDIPFRRSPAEYIPGLGWYQDGRRRRNVKPHYAFVWPKDGKNGSTWGRLKDIMTGKGPDIHLAISPDKEDLVYHRPRRARWARHTNLEPIIDHALRPRKGIREKRAGRVYDFRTRRYVHPYPGMWTDAIWQREPNGHFEYPEAFRRWDGQWWQDPFYSSW